MKIHLLDMGQTKYGDCLIIEHGGRKILVDGGHPGDTNSLRTQFKKILNAAPPFEFDLLIVTHCHSDHIGCLPDLVGLDVIRPKLALIADEKFGFGRTLKGYGPEDEIQMTDEMIVLSSALEEEYQGDLNDDELLQFLDDAATLESKYLNMIERLESNGVTVHRFGKDITADEEGKVKLQAFEKQFEDFGLKILGPSVDHLLKCTAAIASVADFVADDSVLQSGRDSISLTDAYRRISELKPTDDAMGLEDRPGSGAAKNNQSIVFKVAADGWSALLAGDMQFAKAEVKDLTSDMNALLSVVAQNGPYDFVKLTHHTSYNAFNDKVFKAMSSPKLLAHTGGRNDGGHPDEDALKYLQSLKNEIIFARNDRSGIVTVSKSNETVKFEVPVNQLNDFSVNRTRDLLPLPTSNNQRTEIPSFTPTNQAVAPSTPAPTYGTSASDQFVEIIAKVPHVRTKVVLTIDVQPPDGPIARNPDLITDSLLFQSIAPGRNLPELLFVTNTYILEKNIGAGAVKQLLNLIARYPQIKLVNITNNVATAEETADTVKTTLRNGGFKGVVIIGGYDVVPAQRLTVLDNKLRNQLIQKNLLNGDSDRFIVWSDDLYGDNDNDGIPEFPVSRIPDARDASLLSSALNATEFNAKGRFGIRNFARPFAETTYSTIPGLDSLNVSETYGPAHIHQNAALGAVYFMLHGSERDSSRFWGETVDGDEFEAMCVNNIPGVTPETVVFTGCCWGALTVYEPASGKRGLSDRPTSKSPAESIALTYLKAGAQAFVGCTGTHYSPLKSPYDYYGKPMHDQFWNGVVSGLKPAEALFQAKVAYAKDIPHGQTDLFSQAIELKILRQYTCLGLGW
ncbi:MBL fold metallo-hydrolase [Mucilaginibacter lutimaris]|uniref:MBL fold metallo-hydrolase n=1 Tax=Mucilaginibacter lutimaris TaxID=931629 RepID=A0ABW2ZIS4_9SPHI